MQQESYELSEVSSSVTVLMQAGARSIQPNASQLDRHGPEHQQADAAAEGDGTSGAAPSAPVHSPSWSVKKFWEDNVNCVVDFEKCRDHLGK